MYFRLFMCLLVAACSVTAAKGERVAFDFQGEVAPFGGSVFGETVPPFVFPPAMVTGHFEYDTDSAATHMLDADTEGYRQQIPGGFYATLGSTLFVADDYVVAIGDDVASPGGGSGPDDHFIVQFSSAMNDFANAPGGPPVAPLLVNGVPQSAGFLNFDLIGPTSLYSEPITSLPSSLTFSEFTGPSGGSIAESPPPGSLLLFSITNVQPAAVETTPPTPTPEPASWCLFAMGALAGVAMWLRVYRKG